MIASPPRKMGRSDGYGDIDIGVVNRHDVSRVSILLNDGSGTFSGPVSQMPLANDPYSIGAGDVDGDGRPDAVVGHGEFGSGLSWLRALPGPTFAEPERYLVGRRSRWVDVADLDGDGSSDVLFCAMNASELTVLSSDDAGGLAPMGSWRVGADPVAATSADVDREGVLDVLVVNRAGNDVSVLLASEGRHYTCREGNLNAAAGDIADVVTFGGSPGVGTERRVTIGPDTPYDLRVDPPPSAGGAKTPFVLYLWLGYPQPGTVEVAPRFDLGTFCRGTPLGGSRPTKIANSLGHGRAFGNERWPGPPTMPAPTTLASGTIGREVTFFVQGLMPDEAAPNGVAGVTNGILVEVRDP